MDAPQASSRNFMLTATLRFGLFAVLWLVLTEGDIGSWPFGLGAVVVATGVSLSLLPPLAERIHPIALIRFAVLFLRQSIMGGVDVSWRAMHPRLPIRPTLVRYPLRLPPGPAQVTMSNVISLLPGSLAAGIKANCLTLHWIDEKQPVKELLRTEEERIAAVFGIDLPPHASEESDG